MGKTFPGAHVGGVWGRGLKGWRVEGGGEGVGVGEVGVWEWGVGGWGLSIVQSGSTVFGRTDVGH